MGYGMFITVVGPAHFLVLAIEVVWTSLSISQLLKVNEVSSWKVMTGLISFQAHILALIFIPEWPSEM